jgi:hypothetical protein
MHNMKTIIMIMAISVLIMFSGIYSFVDAHVFSWIPSLWITRAQSAVTIIGLLSVIAYATLYVYYVFKHRDKTSSL